MRVHGGRFNHNLHALRIVEHFEHRYIGFEGLNLTFEVREGIVKHSRDYSASEYPELAEYLLDLRPPLESQLIDWVDEIAYNSADLDDALEANLLDLEALRREVPLFADFYAGHRSGASRCADAIEIQRSAAPRDRLSGERSDHQYRVSGARVRRADRRRHSPVTRRDWLGSAIPRGITTQNLRLFSSATFTITRRLLKIPPARSRAWRNCSRSTWTIRVPCPIPMRMPRNACRDISRCAITLPA